MISFALMMQGRAQKFEKQGGGAAEPDIVMTDEQKKIITPAECPIFRPKSREKQKSVITPTGCHLYEYHLCLVHLFAEGREPSPPGYAPVMV